MNKSADFLGGAEAYMARTARFLRERGIRNTLLYNVEGWTEPSFTSAFDAAFPWVNTRQQLAQIAPDIVYVHQLARETDVQKLARGGAPVVRFFHDHKLFCPREHKYTTLGHHTCTRTVGVLGCYSCLGVINRSGTWTKVRLRTVADVREEQEANKSLAGYVVASEYMRQHVVAHGFDGARTHLLPMFVERYATAEPLRRDPHLVVFAGALLRGKGLDWLLRAFVRVREPARLEIIGKGEQEGMFRDLATELDLTSRVEFRGKLSISELHDAFRSAACVVVPSRSPETFGLVGPETLQYETPVVATEVGGMGEWLKDGVTGYSVPTEDIGRLASAIDRVIMNPKTAQELGRAGRELVESHFTPAHHADALMSLFSQLTRKAA